MEFYNTRVLIYANDEIVGYTNTLTEADHLCINNPKYSWDYQPKNVKLDYTTKLNKYCNICMDYTENNKIYYTKYRQFTRYDD